MRRYQVAHKKIKFGCVQSYVVVCVFLWNLCLTQTCCVCARACLLPLLG